MDEIDRFCALIRGSFSGADIVYTRGGCWEFHRILRAIWPEARPYYSDALGHVFTRIGDSYYDIFGKRSKGGSGLKPMGAAAIKGAHRWRSRRLDNLGMVIALHAGLEVEGGYDARL